MCGDITHVSEPYNKTACTTAMWNIPEVRVPSPSLTNTLFSRTHFLRALLRLCTILQQDSPRLLEGGDGGERVFVGAERSYLTCSCLLFLQSATLLLLSPAANVWRGVLSIYGPLQHKYVALGTPGVGLVSLL